MSKKTTVTLKKGDCVKVMRGLDDNSVDAIVTDPPYELGFMGKGWDKSGIANSVEMWAEALRVLKPGGHLLAFSGSRTYHRMVCAIEDAGFEIRDQIMWVYGSGFPKSLDVSKAMDKAAGALAHQSVGFNVAGKTSGLGTIQRPELRSDHPDYQPYAPATDLARQWQGWHTALKPAHEPIVVARKPLQGTVAQNVAQWGTGALNIDGCRVGFTSEADERESKTKNQHGDFGSGQRGNRIYGADKNDRTNYDSPGRWPANLIHDGSPEVMHAFAAQSKVTLSSGGGMKDLRKGKLFQGETQKNITDACGYGDTGTAARFFYCAKASALRMPSTALSPIGARDRGPGFGDTGTAARFFYQAKASRADRDGGLDGTERVSIVGAWESADLKVTLLVDTEQSPPKVIGVSGAPSNDVHEWNTLLFGSGRTALSRTGSTFTTSTKTSSITGSKTLSWLARSLTSASTAAAKSAAKNGGSLAGTAASSTPSLTITSGSTVSLPGVGRVPSKTRLEISASEGRSDHPTVKPRALMEYLCRLVTPPGGTILDPFMGSGSTGIGAALGGFSFIGCDLSADYVEIARKRIAAARKKPAQLPLPLRKAA